MKQLEINNKYALLKTEHGLKILVWEHQDGDLRIALNAPVGQSIRIQSVSGDNINIHRI